jgi:hypothetical protein
MSRYFRSTHCHLGRLALVSITDFTICLLITALKAIEKATYYYRRSLKSENLSFEKNILNAEAIVIDKKGLGKERTGWSRQIENTVWERFFSKRAVVIGTNELYSTEKL